MIYQSGKRIEIVAESTPEAFAKQLNSKMAVLDKSRTKYELQFNHQMGYCAYLVIDKTTKVPECLSEEFELAGETHTCVECPHWVHPTKGNVKYTRCPISSGIRGAKSPCCEAFYEMLLNGDIELVEQEGAR